MEDSNSTKEKILDAGHRLFNEEGVASVTIRKIAAEVGISHSNVTYHFQNKGAILLALHERLLARAIEENHRYRGETDPLKSLIATTERGFSIIFEYRFLMLDLFEIVRTVAGFRERLREIESIRAEMYMDAIGRLIEKNYMRKEEFPGEYSDLIERIRIFSDFWITSGEIYFSGSSEEKIHHHTRLFMSQFFPYLTGKGKRVGGPLLEL